MDNVINAVERGYFADADEVADRIACDILSNAERHTPDQLAAANETNRLAHERRVTRAMREGL